MDLAKETGNSQLTPLHLAVTLFEDPAGIAKSATLRVANEEAWRSSTRVLRKRLDKLPKARAHLDSGCLHSCGDIGLRRPQSHAWTAHYAAARHSPAPRVLLPSLPPTHSAHCASLAASLPTSIYHLPTSISISISIAHSLGSLRLLARPLKLACCKCEQALAGPYPPRACAGVARA